MKRKAAVLVAMAVLGAGVVAEASDPVGIYARIDKVVLEPADQKLEHIQVWGAFALAKVLKGGRGDEYEPPVRGYMYFSIQPGKEDVCRKEWADLQRVAGTGQCLGFGSRYQPKGRIRMATEEAKKPDAYPLGYGLAKMENRATEYPPIKALLELPAPATPAPKQ